VQRELSAEDASASVSSSWMKGRSRAWIFMLERDAAPHRARSLSGSGARPKSGRQAMQVGQISIRLDHLAGDSGCFSVRAWKERKAASVRIELPLRCAQPALPIACAVERPVE